MIETRTSQDKGRGVFAKQLIRKGEIFERAPVIVLPAHEWELMERTVLFNYCYGWGEDSALALGLGSLFNHSYQPNALYTRRFEEHLIEYSALRDINPNEEITINNNGDPLDLDPLWFSVK